MIIEKAPANQEKIIDLIAGAANAHNKDLYLHSVSLSCEHLQRMCCKIDKVVFLICRCFFYLQ